MKVKTSITLSKEVLEQLDMIAKPGESRSEIIEKMLRDGMAEQARRESDLRDLERINDNAEELNEEAEDVLSYQVDF